MESDVYALGRLLQAMLSEEEAGGIPYGLRKLVREAVMEERTLRIPDMRSFLKQLAVYDGTHFLRRLQSDWRARMLPGQAADFYYVQNVRKGMDSRKRIW